MSLPTNLKPGTLIKFTTERPYEEYPFKRGDILTTNGLFEDLGYFVMEDPGGYFVPFTWAELVERSKSGFGRFSAKVKETYGN